MTAARYLTVEDILGMVRRLEIGPVRDIGLIEAAVARPRSSAFGTDAYDTLALKAAALLHSLVRNHGLVDGNKRLALLATVVFLDINSASIDLDDVAAFDLVMRAAEGKIDVEGIASQLTA